MRIFHWLSTIAISLSVIAATAQVSESRYLPQRANALAGDPGHGAPGVAADPMLAAMQQELAR